jgi:hypothetical protein
LYSHCAVWAKMGTQLRNMSLINCAR